MLKKIVLGLFLIILAPSFALADEAKQTKQAENTTDTTDTTDATDATDATDTLDTLDTTDAMYASDAKVFSGVSIGGGGVVGGGLDGSGFFDLGFNLYTKDSFSVRNNIHIFSGGVYTEDSGYGVFGIRERITLGHTHFVTSGFAVKIYGGVDVGLGYYVSDTSPSTPLYIEPRAFGGAEFFLRKQKSKSALTFFMEAGGGAIISLGDVPLGANESNAFISVGGRMYF